MDGYLVFAGNEFVYGSKQIGFIMEGEETFLSLEEAEEIYEKFLKHHGMAVMYKFTGYSIIRVKFEEIKYGKVESKNKCNTC